MLKNQSFSILAAFEALDLLIYEWGKNLLLLSRGCHNSKDK